MPSTWTVPRPLTERERSIADRILYTDAAVQWLPNWLGWREQARTQLGSWLVAEVPGSVGDVVLQFVSQAAVDESADFYCIGMATADDGRKVYARLKITAGQLEYLSFFKEGGVDLSELPDPESFRRAGWSEDVMDYVEVEY